MHTARLSPSTSTYSRGHDELPALHGSAPISWPCCTSREEAVRPPVADLRRCSGWHQAWPQDSVVSGCRSEGSRIAPGYEFRAHGNEFDGAGPGVAVLTHRPRRALHDLGMWRANPTADYGPLDRAARGKIDLSRGSGGVASFTVRASWWTSAARTSRVSVFVQSIPLARGDGRPDGSCAYFPTGVRGIGYPSK